MSGCVLIMFTLTQSVSIHRTMNHEVSCVVLSNGWPRDVRHITSYKWPTVRC